jgi:hypothetical protein
LRIGYFRNLVIGLTVSQLGDQLFLIALPWLVLQISGSGRVLGTILMVEAIPRVLLMLMGGVVTDRFKPKRILAVSFSACTILMTILAFLTWRKNISVPEILFFSFAFGCMDAFAWPAGAALLPSLVRLEQLPAANSIMQSCALLCGFAGPAAAGFIIRAGGTPLVLALDAFSFVCAIAGILTIPKSMDPGPQRGPEGVLQSLREGIKFVFLDKPLLGLCVLVAGMNFCSAGPLRVGIAIMANMRFTSASAFGLMFSVLGLGTLLGTLLAGTQLVKWSRGPLVAGGAVGISLGLATIGLSLPLWGVATVLGLMGFVSGFVNVQLISWIQGRVEPAYMGRVISLAILASIGTAPLSLAAAGAFGVQHLMVMFLSAAAMLLLVTMVGAFSGSFRKIDA